MFLRSLVNLSFDNLHQGLPPSTVIHPKDYARVIRRLSRVYDHFVTVEGHRRSSQQTTFPMDAVLTEFGSCSTFNSRVLNTISWDHIFSGAERPDQPVHKTFYAQGEAVVTMLALNETGALDIYYHSPLGIPQALHRVRMATASPAALTTLKFSSTDIVAHVKVKKLYQYQRRCLFFYEGQLEHSPHVYSQELCLRECRIQRMKGLCGCLPPFYRLAGHWERYCAPGDDINCVARNFGELVDCWVAPCSF